MPPTTTTAAAAFVFVVSAATTLGTTTTVTVGNGYGEETVTTMTWSSSGEDAAPLVERYSVPPVASYSSRKRFARERCRAAARADYFALPARPQRPRPKKRGRRAIGASGRARTLLPVS